MSAVSALQLALVMLLLIGSCECSKLVLLSNEGISWMNDDGTGLEMIITWVQAGHPPCDPRGLTADPATRKILYTCEDLILHIIDISDPANPVHREGHTSSGPSLTSISVGNGAAYFSEYDAIGWRLWRFDLMTEKRDAKDMLSFLTSSALGGGVTIIGPAIYLTFDSNNKGGSIAWTTDGTVNYLNKILATWSAGLVGFPFTSGTDLYYLSIEDTSSTLYKADLTDATDPVKIPVTLPQYDPLDSFVGTGTRNRQPAMDANGDRIYFLNVNEVVSIKSDGSDRKTLYIAPGAIPLAMCYFAYYDTPVPTEIPDTAIPTAIPTAVPTAVPTGIPTDSPTDVPGTGATTKSPTAVPGTPTTNSPGTGPTTATPGGGPTTPTPGGAGSTSSPGSSGGGTYTPGITPPINPTPPPGPTPTTGVLTSSPSEEDDDEMWPFGNGPKVPFVMIIIGAAILCTGIGALCYSNYRTTKALEATQFDMIKLVKERNNNGHFIDVDMIRQHHENSSTLDTPLMETPGSVATPGSGITQSFVYSTAGRGRPRRPTMRHSISAVSDIESDITLTRSQVTQDMLARSTSSVAI
eukprot:TRINITY_DN16720_c0_g1_i1.p1 TRINITY_DN16720_c0_g1~~TRINITY_DN16720_c0_g1_i1.p1  ORF type:complete len:580 (+),score=108.77 TRINITY_DN16720_c0_g1_i1:68-1807(+)